MNNKQSTCIALVHGVLEYGATLYILYMSRTIGGTYIKIEQIQHPAARFITGDYRSRHPGYVTSMDRNLNLKAPEN